MRIKASYYGRIKKGSGILMRILKSIITLKGGGELELNEKEIKFTRDEPKRTVFRLPLIRIKKVRIEHMYLGSFAFPGKILMFTYLNEKNEEYTIGFSLPKKDVQRWKEELERVI